MFKGCARWLAEGDTTEDAFDCFDDIDTLESDLSRPEFLRNLRLKMFKEGILSWRELLVDEHKEEVFSIMRGIATELSEI